jgi:hypothetical protein
MIESGKIIIRTIEDIDSSRNIVLNIGKEVKAAKIQIGHQHKQNHINGHRNPDFNHG